MSAPSAEEEEAEEVERQAPSEEAKMLTAQRLLPWCSMTASGWLAPRPWMSLPGGTDLASNIAEVIGQSMAAFRFEMLIRLMRYQTDCSASDTSLFRRTSRQGRMLDQAIKDPGTSLSHYKQLVESQGSSAHSS